MRRYHWVVFVFVLAAVLSTPMVAAESKGISATLIGENYCLHCTLVMDEGSEETCGPETCSYALKVKKAKDAAGKPIEALEGITVHYIKSEAAAALTDGPNLLGQEVEVTGTAFVEERAIDVKSAAPHDVFAEFDDLIWDKPNNRASARR
jgi:hypothetical protein